METINGSTKLLGLMGNPVEHTLSPIIHNHLSKALHKNMVYVPFLVKEEGLEDAVKGAAALGIAGLNVTVPHKNQVMEYVAELDEAAKVIGAVNTLVLNEDGTGYKGYNTDMPGLLRELQAEQVSLKDKHVVILGAGGASKAVCYMCMQEQAAKIYLLNRTVDKAAVIAKHLNDYFGVEKIVPMPLEAYHKLPKESYIVFQATSIGLAPNCDAAVIEDEAFYQQVAVGVDLIYNPAETKFMKLVKKAGGKAFNGLRMLLYQGIIAYELWNHVHISKQLANETYALLCEAIYPKHDNVVLVGFMGAGKSGVGRKLANVLKYDFIDTDFYIEQKEGMKISEIFEQKGEDYFRALETSVLEELLAEKEHAVISTGGGMPLRNENAILLKQIGTVVYLKARPDTIYHRIKGDTTRPLLRCEKPMERIVELLGKRESKYLSVSDIVIQTDHYDKDACVAVLRKKLKYMDKGGRKSL